MAEEESAEGCIVLAVGLGGQPLALHGSTRACANERTELSWGKGLFYHLLNIRDPRIGECFETKRLSGEANVLMSVGRCEEEKNT